MLWWEEGGRMYWYNPKTRCTETVPAPATDREALALLGGDINTMAFAAEYERLRESGMGIEQALIFTGHEFRGSSTWSSGRRGNHRTRKGRKTPVDQGRLARSPVDVVHCHCIHAVLHRRCPRPGGRVDSPSVARPSRTSGCSRNPVRLLVKKPSKNSPFGGCAVRAPFIWCSRYERKQGTLPSRREEVMGPKGLAVSGRRRYDHAVTQRESREIGSVFSHLLVGCASRNDKRSKGLAGADRSPSATGKRRMVRVPAWAREFPRYRNYGRGRSRSSGRSRWRTTSSFPARSRPCPSRDRWSTCTSAPRTAWCSGSTTWRARGS